MNGGENTEALGNCSGKLGSEDEKLGIFRVIGDLEAKEEDVTVSFKELMKMGADQAKRSMGLREIGLSIKKMEDKPNDD
ncbi:hypothetical protein V6N13_125949 [Hibiscus sabdariffa]|uniref:Uncharacterized protein n=1 Tax=Hibiscus sabdariffa TaxID=183260 RepID=A0ABR2NXH9_9ROSI